MDKQDKEKIIWLRNLLKTNSPRFYKYYKAYKLAKRDREAATHLSNELNNTAHDRPTDTLIKTTLT